MKKKCRIKRRILIFPSIFLMFTKFSMYICNKKILFTFFKILEKSSEKVLNWVIHFLFE